MKKVLLTLGLILILATTLSAATYDDYSKEDGKLKVGKVYYKKWTLERLLEEKVYIEEEYQRATDRYNKDLVEINKLIVEAGKLNVTAISP